MPEDNEQPLKKKKQLSQNIVRNTVKAVNGIQVNHCKNPQCANFNVPYTGLRGDRNYKRYGTTLVTPPLGYSSTDIKLQSHPAYGTKSNSAPYIQCKKCNECPPLKNNHGISEVLKLWNYHPDNSSCPNEACKNHPIPIDSGGFYKKNGKTNAGTARWICKACGKSFVERAQIRPSRDHEKPYRYEDIVTGLVNCMPFNRMMEIYQISPKSIYHYIEKAYESCVRFNRNREQRLPEVLSKRGAVYFATDRQDLLVNWDDRRDRNTIPVKAACSVDIETGFVYRYDVGIDDISNSDIVHQESLDNGDVDKAFIFRKYPHLFIPSDMSDERRINGFIQQERQKAIKRNINITEEELKYLEAKLRPDVELPSFHLTDGTGLPNNCLLLREDYQLYAHYFSLEKIFSKTDKVINFADQESGLRAAFMSSFAHKIMSNNAHLFYITFEKGVIQGDREAAKQRTTERIKETVKKNECSEETAKIILCIDAIKKYTSPVGHWRDLWGYHPLESMTEVEKRFSHQTYKPNQDDTEIGCYLSKGGLHAVDNYFMRVRRRISQLERGLPTASADRRLWYGKNFYRPDMVKKSSTILMTYLNYCATNNKKDKTPAEKLGIAKGPVRLRDILEF